MLPLGAALAVLVAATSEQGQTIRILKLSAFGATTGDTDAVQRALKQELEAEGNAVVSGEEAKGVTAIISGSVTKVGESYVINLSIIRESDHRVLDHVRAEAKAFKDLAQISTNVAKQLASALRAAMGVRAKVKPQPSNTAPQRL